MFFFFEYLHYKIFTRSASTLELSIKFVHNEKEFLKYESLELEHILTKLFANSSSLCILMSK